jgi:phosphoribosylglycinamide formyltransferase 1
MAKKKILVFATGTATSGGSGADNLIRRSKIDDLGIEIIGLVSNHARGGVYSVAQSHGIPFHFFSSGTWSAKEYQQVFKKFPHDLVALSGWLKPVRGNNGARTINIHPARLPRFGGTKMYGDNIHAAVLEAFKKSEIKFSGVSMHFVPDFDDAEYDKGPVFFDYWVPLEKGDTLESIKRRVNTAEHYWQPYITSLVAQGRIRWSAKKNKIIVPSGYPFMPKS